MPYKELSAGSAQLKKLCGLSQSRMRTRFSQQRVEGVQAVRELVQCEPRLVRDIYTTRAVLAQHPEIVRAIDEHNMYVHIGDDDLLAKVAPHAQGIVAVANLPELANLEYIFRQTPLVVCCVQANDPGNVGTIIRTADACGAGGVVLGEGSVDSYSPKVIRSAAGSTFHLPVRESSVCETVAEAKRHGFQVILADAGGEVSLGDLDNGTARRNAEASPHISLATPTLWLVGNEAHGFSEEHKNLADVIVSIPMWGKTESLNLAVATGVCLYASANALFSPYSLRNESLAL